MPKAYIVGRAVVRDPQAWARYAAGASEAMKTYGATVLARGGRTEVLEGEGRARNVVLEFASVEAARSYYYSPEYQAAKALRDQAGFIDLVLVEGV